MNLAKVIIYVLVCIGMGLTALFFEELGMFSIIITYTLGIGIGFVVWKK